MPNVQSKTTFIDPPGMANSKADADQTNDEAEAGAAEAEQEDAGEVAERDEAGEAEPSAESRARKMGWRPKDEYEKSGRDPEKWVSAAEFVRRGENELPVLRERFRKMEKITEKQAKQLDEGNKLLKDLVASQKAERDKAVKSALAKSEKDRREAISIGDVAETERLSAEIEEHKEELKKPVPAEREQRAENKAEIPDEVLEWVDANPWFNTDEDMNALATRHYGKLMADKTLTDTQRLAKTKAEVVRRYPEKFGNPRRAQPGAVESGNGAGGRGRAMQKGWGDLPRDAQDIGDRLIRQGAVKDKAAYLKDYAW